MAEIHPGCSGGAGQAAMLRSCVQQCKACADRVRRDALGIKPQRPRHCAAHRAKAANPGRFDMVDEVVQDNLIPLLTVYPEHLNTAGNCNLSPYIRTIPGALRARKRRINQRLRPP